MWEEMFEKQNGKADVTPHDAADGSRNREGEVVRERGAGGTTSRRRPSGESVPIEASVEVRCAAERPILFAASVIDLVLCENVANEIAGAPAQIADLPGSFADPRTPRACNPIVTSPHRCGRSRRRRMISREPAQESPHEILALWDLWILRCEL